jgi:hypothetical protein
MLLVPDYHPWSLKLSLCDFHVLHSLKGVLKHSRIRFGKDIKVVNVQLQQMVFPAEGIHCWYVNGMAASAPMETISNDLYTFTQNNYWMVSILTSLCMYTHITYHHHHHHHHHHHL